MGLLAQALAVLVPPACLACGEATHSAEPLCPGCRAELPWLRALLCPRCALPAPCGAPCPAARAPWNRAWAPLAHAGPAREVVHALKFRGALGAADLMAAAIVARSPAGLFADAALVPVPADPARARARGIDHAARLARALARRTGRRIVPVLVSGGEGVAQVGAGRSARLAPGRLGLAAGGPAPSTAVLVDDVHTTGATLAAGARALRVAGAREVSVVTYSRALP